MFNGKKKAVTFSYDDGVTQDSRLISVLNKYGLKGTFNLNSGLLGTDNHLIINDKTISHVKPRACEVRTIYEGHEIAAHTLTHPNLTGCDEAEIIRQVEQDRLMLSEIAGYEITGMAYPGGGVNFNHDVAEVIRNNTNIKYARTTVCTGNFDIQSNLLEFRPTVRHADFDRLFSLAREFISLEPDEPKLFYIWGHSYEFDVDDTWDEFEEFCKFISGRDDIFYGANREVLQ